MLIPYISSSRESLWHECQEKYRLKYHLQIIPDGPVPFYFTFGKIVHKIIEEHTRHKGRKPLNVIRSEVSEGKIHLEPGKVAPHLDNETNAKLSLHLSNYLRLVDKIGYDGEVEWSFDIDLDPPGAKMVKGVIDRLIVKGDNIFIIDYKTSKPSKWRKDHTTITKDLQLACYCWVVNKVFGVEANKIKAALYYLEDAKLVPVCFSESTLKSVPERLLRVFRDIENTHPDKAIGIIGDHCRRCEWRKHCRFYRLT